MLKLLPIILGLFVGFMLALLLLRQAGARNQTAKWERQYRELHGRYRNLTQRLQDVDRTAEAKSNRLRQKLLDVGEILSRKQSDSAAQVDKALQEIKAALAQER
jgi:hypothetical protein